MINIIKGEDKVFLIKLRDMFGDPFDLTDVTHVVLKIPKQDGGYLVLDLNQVPASRASAIYNNVIFTADSAGVVGNNIVLEFDGVSSVQAVVNAFNLSNIDNTVSVTAPQGVNLNTLVFPAMTLRLSGGMNAYYPLQIVTPRVLGKIQVILTDLNTELLKTGVQTLYLTLDFGEAPAGVRKRITLPDALNIQKFTS